MKRTLIAGLCTLCILSGLTSITSAASAESKQASVVHAIVPATSKASSQSIRIFWSSAMDEEVSCYYVMRRGTKNSKGTGKWETIAEVDSDGVKGGPANTYTDQLSTSRPQQYAYKICTLSADEKTDTRNAKYADETNPYSVLGSNIKVCIDPGHFADLNNNYGLTGDNGKYPYAEGAFCLKIGTALQKELQQAYGIDSFMTRTGKSISLLYNGNRYTNEKLDNANITVRGSSAKTENCDFFISLHTNASSRQKNPWNQSQNINKSFVFVNQSAHSSPAGMNIANSIGLNLTAYNQKAGMQTAGFTTQKKNKAPNFSTQNNDSTKTNGTVIYRSRSGGDDYLGVLRGANTSGVQGILVEHAYHVTRVMRKQAAASPDLYQNWAACDAYGIAYGYGFVSSIKQP